MAAFVILTPGFPKDENDTTCLPAIQQFVLSLKKLHPEIPLIILSFQYPYQRKEYVWNGIRVIALGGRNKEKIFRLLVWVRAYMTLRKLHKKDKIFGLLSLWLGECALVGEYFRKANKIKHYMWAIGQDTKVTNQYIKRIKPKGSKIIAMSDFIKEEFYKNHKEMPFLVAENGITESIFPELNIGKRDIDVLGVGSLIPLKNYKLFIEIISEIKKKRPDIKAVIIGTGDEEENLKSLIKQNDLSQNIELVGLQAHSAVLEFMNISKVFLHTSVFEGNSTVLMEALYSGCIVVSKQELNNKQVKNLLIKNTKEEMVHSILNALEKKQSVERILFNSMDTTAEAILNLFR